jgi:hypothetical protein
VDYLLLVTGFSFSFLSFSFFNISASLLAKAEILSLALIMIEGKILRRKHICPDNSIQKKFVTIAVARRIH